MTSKRNATPRRRRVFTVTADRFRITTDFLSLAYDDYLGARLLLRNDLLSQAVTLAASSVEKYFKAIVALRGNRCEGHLSSALIRSVANYQPVLFKQMKPDFLSFLAKAYKLRYIDTQQHGFAIKISKNRTLLELDRTVRTIEEGLSFERDGKPVPTRYRDEREKRNPLLVESNVAVGTITEADYLRQRDKLIIIAVDHRVGIVRAHFESYQTGQLHGFDDPVPFKADDSGRFQFDATPA